LSALCLRGVMAILLSEILDGDMIDRREDCERDTLGFFESN
jgi:hypothetical protein